MPSGHEHLRTCIIGEQIAPPFDEGIKGIAYQLLRSLRATHPAVGISVNPAVPVDGLPGVVPVRSNRLFISRELQRAVRRAAPSLIVYISPSGAKLAALLRARFLRSYAAHAAVAVVALQAGTYGRLGAALARRLKPDLVFAQTPKAIATLRRIDCPAAFLPSGVDTQRFVPADPVRKLELRRRYGVERGAQVVLHVGHISHNRNVDCMTALAGIEGLQPILVGSTSTPQDGARAAALVAAGVRVIREHVPHVEEMYQLSDAYLFPVVADDACIGVPLSVLEAMACNLPVVSTRFGGLPLMFDKGAGMVYYDREDELPRLLAELQKAPHSDTRRMVERYDWRDVAEMLVCAAMPGRCSP